MRHQRLREPGTIATALGDEGGDEQQNEVSNSVAAIAEVQQKRRICSRGGQFSKMDGRAMQKISEAGRVHLQPAITCPVA